MRILIVDNGSKSLQHLFLALSGHQVDVKRFEDFDIDPSPTAQSTDLVILSGGSQYPVVGNEVRFVKEIELVLESPLPILGICFGFELIAYAFTSELYQIEKRIEGPRLLTLLKPDDPLFELRPPLQVYESHTWGVKKLGDDLVALAKSDTGIGIFRHKTLPRYGFQFHPEAGFNTAGGIPLLEGALKTLTRK